MLKINGKLDILLLSQQLIATSLSVTKLYEFPQIQKVSKRFDVQWWKANMQRAKLAKGTYNSYESSIKLKT